MLQRKERVCPWKEGPDDDLLYNILLLIMTTTVPYIHKYA